MTFGILSQQRNRPLQYFDTLPRHGSHSRQPHPALRASLAFYARWGSGVLDTSLQLHLLFVQADEQDNRTVWPYEIETKLGLHFATGHAQIVFNLSGHLSHTRVVHAPLVVSYQYNKKCICSLQNHSVITLDTKFWPI